MPKTKKIKPLIIHPDCYVEWAKEFRRRRDHESADLAIACIPDATRAWDAYEAQQQTTTTDNNNKD